MEVRNAGMRRVLCLKDGSSERGSGIQEGTGEEGDCRGAQPGRRDARLLLRREIEHKALLSQVQALCTRATDYLVSNHKTISHQA